MKLNHNKSPYAKLPNRLFNNRVNTQGNQFAGSRPVRNCNRNLNRRINTENDGDASESKKYALNKAKNIPDRLSHNNKQNGFLNKHSYDLYSQSYKGFQWRSSGTNNKKIKKYRIRQQESSIIRKNDPDSDDTKVSKVRNTQDNYREERPSNKFNAHSLVAKKIKQQIIDKERRKNKASQKANLSKEQNEQDFHEILKNKKNLSISDFNIIKLIGAGTFGKVYHATYRNSGIKVAIKKVLNDKNYKNREIQLMRVVNNPFVIRQFADFVTLQPNQKDSEDQYKQYYHFVMPTYSSNLYQHLQRTKLHGLETKIVLYQIFRGLLYFHSRGICHRDLKPQNILINQSKNLVICDLGSAKILKKGEGNIAYICSRCYRAPELIFGNNQYTVSIDIWSAGCIILQILNGQPLFIGGDSLQHLVEIIKVMGTPSKQQISLMNPDYDVNNFSVAKIFKKQWNQIFPKVQPNLISLLNNIMVYSPQHRSNAAEVLVHPYFNQLRQQVVFKAISKETSTKNFFVFDHYESKYVKDVEKLIPSWYKNK